jgi:hypothetical protein
MDAICTVANREPQHISAAIQYVVAEQGEAMAVPI